MLTLIPFWKILERKWVMRIEGQRWMPREQLRKGAHNPKEEIRVMWTYHVSSAFHVTLIPTLQGRFSYHYFIDKKWDSEREGDSSKARKFWDGRGEIWTQAPLGRTGFVDVPPARGPCTWFYCCCLEILNNCVARGSTLSLYAGHSKLCSWTCFLALKPMLFPSIQTTF